MKKVLFPLLLPGLLAAQQFTIADLNVYGNRRTRAEVVFRELEIAAGDSVSNRDLLAERGWLLRQRLFKRVEFQVKAGSGDHEKEVLMVVQEYGRFSGSPILGNNDLFGWYAGGTVHLRNLLGYNTRLSATAQAGGIDLLGLEWSHPWFGGRARLFASLGFTALDRPYRYSDYDRTFAFRNRSVALTAGRGFGRRIQAGLRLKRDAITVSETAVTFSGRGTDHLNTAGLFLFLDTRDWPLYPRQGVRTDISAFWTGTDESWLYRGLDLDFRAYMPVIAGNILALQTVLSLRDGDVPVYSRLHIGGGNTVRGYPTGHSAGTNAFYAGLEYRFPVVYERTPLAGLHAGWAGVLFLDTGTAWFPETSPLDSDWLLSAGLGVHIIWDSFVLRAEYGNRGSGRGFITTGTSVKF
ncbi:BamA/TamA family outer membrane protein [bacterium]|nr:BamA/TamA family outer membrane protein [bacterium]